MVRNKREEKCRKEIMNYTGDIGQCTATRHSPQKLFYLQYRPGMELH